MKFVKFTGGNGYCGCDFEEYIAFNDDVENGVIDECLDNLSYDNAEAYEYVATGWDEEWESDEDREIYYEDAVDSGSWEFVTEEEYLENTH